MNNKKIPEFPSISYWRHRIQEVYYDEKNGKETENGYADVTDEFVFLHGHLISKYSLGEDSVSKKVLNKKLTLIRKLLSHISYDELEESDKNFKAIEKSLDKLLKGLQNE